jgi:uncharacterized protein (UPF0264 family)
MTQLLISVTSVEEARIAAENGADIIDLKDPHSGALGALPLPSIQSIMAYMRSEQVGKLVSATIGDVPMELNLTEPNVVERVTALAASGVDFIKIGFFEAKDYQPCLGALLPAIQSGVQLIAVLFAEYQYPDSLVDDIHQAGFAGLMLDTAHKCGQTILYYHSCNNYAVLAEKVKNKGMAFGLAGSLRVEDIDQLKHLAPTYMGFRGGVCEQNSRIAALDKEKIIAIKKVL